MAKRRKSLNDILEQSQRIRSALYDRGMYNYHPRYKRVVNATMNYLKNISKSNVLSNIEKRDRAKNNGILTERGIDKQYNAKVGRSTYMGLNKG